jgi:hypothetical protein
LRSDDVGWMLMSCFASAKWFSSYSGVWEVSWEMNRLLTVMFCRRRVFFRSLVHSILLHTFYSDYIYTIFNSYVSLHIYSMRQINSEALIMSRGDRFANPHHSFNCFEIYKVLYRCLCSCQVWHYETHSQLGRLILRVMWSTGERSSE